MESFSDTLFQSPGRDCLTSQCLVRKDQAAILKMLQAGERFTRRVEGRLVKCNFLMWQTKTRKAVKVQQYYKLTLQSRVFLAWHGWVKYSCDHTNGALRSVLSHQCRTVFALWKLRLEQKWEVDQRHVNRHQGLARDTLHCWHEYTQRKQILQALHSGFIEQQSRRWKEAAFRSWQWKAVKKREAQRFLQSTLQVRVMLVWWSFVQAERKLTATVTHRATNTCLHLAFLTWRHRLDILKRQLMVIKIITERRQNRVLQCVLSAWRCEVKAMAHYSQHLAHKYVLLWHRAASACRHQSEEHCCKQLGQKYLRRWREEVVLRRFQRQKEIQRMEATWLQWKTLVEFQLFVQGLQRQRLLDSAWRAWRRRVIQCQVSCAVAEQQDHSWMSDVFEAWHQWAAFRKAQTH
nr:PREDICTED: uncharacterized protein C1orf167 homolog [Latimeria chalumnae]|eukprot:XP_014344185.1 PREDICTED: uncharacterized protein C1orf167 homolog [Latimeria chalumnae]